MATRFKAEFYSELGESYVVMIDDAQYSGGPTPFFVSGEGFKINYSAQNQKRWNPIIASECSFMMVIENSTHEAFITDLATSAEGRFTVRVNINTIELYWCGYVMADIAVLEDAPFRYNFEVVAVDGLGRLKDIDFAQSTIPYTGWDDFKSLVFKCLSLDAMQQYFGGSDSYLRIAVDWWESLHGAVSVSKDPFALTRVQHFLFYKIEKNGANKFKSCHDVLTMILSAWAARIYWSDGKYRIEQINIRNAATYVERSYSKTGTYLNNFTVSQTIAVLQTAGKYRLAGGTYTFWPAIAEAKCEYQHHSWNNIISMLPSYWYKDDGATAHTASYTLNNLGIETTHSLKIGGVLKMSAHLNGTPGTFPGTITVYGKAVFKFIVKLNVGGTEYWLKRLTHSQGGSPFIIAFDPATWETSASHVEVTTELTNLADFTAEIPWEVWSPPLPVDADSIEVKFEFLAFWDYLNSSIPHSGSTLKTYALQSPYILVYENNLPANTEDTRTYYKFNSSSGNTEKYGIEMVFGDGIYPWSLGRMQVYNGTNWVNSAGLWKIAGEGTARLFAETLIYDVMRGHELPVKRVRGRVFGKNIVAGSKLNAWDNKAWLFLGGTFTANKEEWAGEWFEIGAIVTAPGGGIGTVPGTQFPDPTTPGQPPGMVAVGGPNIAINPTGVSAMSILSQVKIDTELSPGSLSSFSVNTALKQNAFEVGDSLFIINPITGLYDTVTVTAPVEDGDTSVAVDGILDNYYPIHATIIKDPTQPVAQSSLAKPIPLLRHFFSTTSPNTVFPVNLGRLVTKIVVVSTVDCTVTVGDAALRPESIMRAKYVKANTPLIYDAGFFFKTAGNVYVGGMAGTTQFYIWFI